MKFFGAIVFLLLWLGLADPSWGMASPWILQADGQYCLQMPTLRLRVDPLHGARITDFRLGFANLDGGWDGWGANVLLSANIEPMVQRFGSALKSSGVGRPMPRSIATPTVRSLRGTP